MKNLTAAKADPAPARNPFLGYFFDIVAPFVAYFIVHRFGAPAFWALTAGGLVAGASTTVNSIRRKNLDAVGVLVLLELVASIIFLLVLRDPRLLFDPPFLLYRHSLHISGVFGSHRTSAVIRRS